MAARIPGCDVFPWWLTPGTNPVRDSVVLDGDFAAAFGPYHAPGTLGYWLRFADAARTGSHYYIPVCSRLDQPVQAATSAFCVRLGIADENLQCYVVGQTQMADVAMTPRTAGFSCENEGTLHVGCPGMAQAEWHERVTSSIASLMRPLDISTVGVYPSFEREAAPQRSFASDLDECIALIQAAEAEEEQELLSQVAEEREVEESIFSHAPAPNADVLRQQQSLAAFLGSAVVPAEEALRVEQAAVDAAIAASLSPNKRARHDPSSSSDRPCG